jgi:hypothetical protein
MSLGVRKINGNILSERFFFLHDRSQVVYRFRTHTVSEWVSEWLSPAVEGLGWYLEAGRFRGSLCDSIKPRQASKLPRMAYHPTTSACTLHMYCMCMCNWYGDNSNGLAPCRATRDCLISVLQLGEKNPGAPLISRRGVPLFTLTFQSFHFL